MIQPEEVCRIVARLDGGETVPRRPWIGRPDTRLVIVHDEAHVRAAVPLKQGRGKRSHPCFAIGPIIDTVVERRHDDQNSTVAMRESRGVARYASHGPAEHSNLGNAHPGV